MHAAQQSCVFSILSEVKCQNNYAGVRAGGSRGQNLWEGWLLREASRKNHGLHEVVST